MYLEVAEEATVPMKSNYRAAIASTFLLVLVVSLGWVVHKLQYIPSTPQPIYGPIYPVGTLKRIVTNGGQYVEETAVETTCAHFSIDRFNNGNQAVSGTPGDAVFARQIDEYGGEVSKSRTWKVEIQLGGTWHVTSKSTVTSTECHAQ
jgi:hypothetical protein